jgi:hypothetical protein
MGVSMTDLATIWKSAAAPTKLDKRSLTVHRGRVVSVADRVTSTTYSGKYGNHTSVNSVPEVWIADASGKERRFADVTLEACRPGHEVAIIVDPAKGQVLAMNNVSTGQNWYTPSLSHLPFNFAHVWGMGTVALLFCGIAWFLSIAHFGEVHSRHTWWARTAPDLMFYSALALAWWVAEVLRNWFNRRSERLRARIDRKIKALDQ